MYFFSCVCDLLDIMKINLSNLSKRDLYSLAENMIDQLDCCPSLFAPA